MRSIQVYVLYAKVIVRKICQGREGLDSLIKFSKEWKDDSLLMYLRDKKANGGDVVIHASCRRDYVNQRRLESFKKSSKNGGKKVKTRASFDNFDWKQHCFFCGKDAVKD